MAECIFNSGTEPNYFNSKWQIEQKILCALNAAGAGGGSSGPNLFGSGDPAGVVSATGVGQLYRNSDTGTMWQATAVGSGSWVQFV